MIYIYSHLVRVEDGGERLLDRDGVPCSHTLPGHHVPPHPSLVLHLHITIIIIIVIIIIIITIIIVNIITIVTIIIVIVLCSPCLLSRPAI